MGYKVTVYTKSSRESKHVYNNDHLDRMEGFVQSETVVYLYDKIKVRNGYNCGTLYRNGFGAAKRKDTIRQTPC